MITFNNASNKMPKNCIFAKFLLLGGKVQGALRKKLLIGPFIGPLKMLLWESLTKNIASLVLLIKFTSTWKNLLEHHISAEFLLIEA